MKARLPSTSPSTRISFHCSILSLSPFPQERVLGFHFIGPNAGEVTQGYALGIKLGATKSDFDATIGIHPTNSENFTTLKNTKRSGVDVTQTGC